MATCGDYRWSFYDLNRFLTVAEYDPFLTAVGTVGGSVSQESDNRSPNAQISAAHYFGRSRLSVFASAIWRFVREIMFFGGWAM
jgi:hypothetical protein